MTKSTPDSPARDDIGKFSDKIQTDPEEAVALNPRDKEVVQAAQRLNRLAAGLHPGAVRVAFTYQGVSAPALVYLIRHDGLTMEVSERNGPVTSSDDGETYADPSALFDRILSSFPSPEEAVSSGFATTDDGVIYLVSARQDLPAMGR
jgi:hypothetical protein